MTTTPLQIERELAALRGSAAGEQAGMRTHIVDLVAFADDAAVATACANAIGALRHSRPSRALVACGIATATGVTAESSVFCSPMQEGGHSLVCCELVRLQGPSDGVALASMAASLLLPDLPVFLLWLAPLDPDETPFASLRPLATRLVTDSTRHPATLDVLGGLIAQGREIVTDLAWTKITGWREVIAAIFDDPDHAERLGRLEQIAIRYVRGSAAQARLLAGWLASSAETDPALALDPVARDDMRAGSLLQVALTAGGVRFVVDRPEEGVAIVDAPGRPRRWVALRVPPFETLIGEELDFLTQDHAFLRAVAAVS